MNPLSIEAPAWSDNPFATRFTRPGAIPFVFPREFSGESLAAQFCAAGRRGAVVGPHGSGKSTLLATLAPPLRKAADCVEIVALHDAQRRMPRGFAERLTAASVLIVDGYEQLSFWGRREVRRAIDRCGAGLLVTSHADVRGLPTLRRTATSVELAETLVRRLSATAATNDAALAITRAELDSLYLQCRGDLRELFFRLYDLYESR